MFSAYMQEVNFYNFNLFYLRLSFAPHIFVGISSFRVCGVVLWLGSGRKINLLHTHTPHARTHQHFTNNFSVHTTPLHTWPTLKKLPLHKRHLTISNCWTLDNRIIGRSGFRCDTPDSSWKPLLSSYVAEWACFFALAVPNQFRYPARGQDLVSLMHANRRLLTEERLFSPAYYYAVGTSGYAVKWLITSVVLWLDYLQTSLFISIQDNSQVPPGCPTSAVQQPGWSCWRGAC
jgi:hypothetical protein